MRIKLENFQSNIIDFIRTCGYRPLEQNLEGELNCVRSLMGQDYPRFHCYIKQEGGALTLNLHLDQKRPSYAGSSRHSGEYESEVVEAEAERIREIFTKKR